MSMASEYLTMQAPKAVNESTLRFKAMIEELERKPLQVRAETAIAVLDTLFDQLESSGTNETMLKEFEVTAYRMIMPESDATDAEADSTLH